jgi:hypothetical protein
MFHSGNCQRIAYRRRYPEETLYISQLIEPHVYPRYGKAHVGFNIAPIKDAVSRWKLNKLPRCTSDRDGGSGRNGGYDCDESGPKGGGGTDDGPQGNLDMRQASGGKSLKEGFVVPSSGITGEHMVIPDTEYLPMT